MEDRWSDDAASGLDDLGLLVYRSTLLGADPAVVNRGGGNTSVKRTVKDFRGRGVDVLTVKASGFDLRTIAAQGFCDVALEDARATRTFDRLSDEAMVDYLAHALLESAAPRPSIETLLHAFLPARHVDHTYADAANALANAAEGEAIARRLFGAEVLWVPYVRPGFTMAKMVADEVDAHADARWVLLQKHGLVTWADDAEECYRRSVSFAGRVLAYLDDRRRNRPVFAAVRPALPDSARAGVLDRVLPPLRAALSRPGRVVLHMDSGPDVMVFLSAAEGPELAEAGLACPDHVLSTGVRPLWLDLPDSGDVAAMPGAVHAAVEGYERAYQGFFERRRTPG